MIIIIALLVFTLISIGIELAAHRLIRLVDNVAASKWIMTFFVVPAARTIALVAFILIAYPALFGFEQAPGINELLAQGRSRFMTLVNIIFILSLLLPLLPVLNRLPALILPLQGIAAASVVFHWWAGAQGLSDIRYWPGWITVGGLLVLAILTHELARWLVDRLEITVDRIIHRQGSGPLIYRSVVMLMQVPVILLYTQALGNQFS